VRGYPLIGRRSRLLGAILAAPLVAGCAAAGTPSTAPSPVAAVTISSAPGETLAFEPADTTIRASGPISITFRNGSSLPHNLVFTGEVTGATRTIVEPGASSELLLAPTAPGAYPFACTIHDGMGGTLIVVDNPTSRIEGALGSEPIRATSQARELAGEEGFEPSIP